MSDVELCTLYVDQHGEWRKLFTFHSCANKSIKTDTLEFHGGSYSSRLFIRYFEVSFANFLYRE